MSSAEGLARVLISTRRIRRRVKQLGEQIAADYADVDLVLLAVLKGAVCFLTDLMREIPGSVEVEFVTVSSYRGMKPGELRLKEPIGADLSDRHVLLVEDIVDSGATARLLVSYVESLGARTVEVCSLLEKPAARRHAVRVKYVGFQIPDVFVIGYGLDLDGRYRNLPHIAVIDQGRGPAA